ncbi:MULTISPECIES: glycosyl hydrolase family 28-related protein [unclassified Paenibacillus]|uniref:glycosyl hydrolase family 28-related protein n=1 Tax=unclassified Paenibacillus TaxID=185978 RepID=UPI00247451A1|nr:MULTISPECIES: glycosyl hydrolase family 28-related protein [unclassified Paenibacillus]MDH6427280.1 hypothetical protein [Paenibacillus sp. PastH-4]MDH6443310.1 hypothetical protein [Paenibacillus sp. PastF-4]MDH6525986.1 hypothetical protein [Paenibacillus sp. PastH-3]
MANKIQFRRGLKSALPTLSVGEPAITTDTGEVYVGHAGGNVGLATASQLADTVKKRDLFFNVKDYGAKGDNSDDTNSFKQAIAAASVLGGIVYIPAVKYWYRIQDTLEIPTSVKLVGENATFGGGSILGFFMDGKPLTKPAINITSADNVHFESIYVLNKETEKRIGIHINGGTTNPELNSFVSMDKVTSIGWSKCFAVNNTWIVSFRDCYAGRSGDKYGYFIDGGTITTCLLDHCYATSCDVDYHIGTAYYSTLIACAADYARIGYEYISSKGITMIGCASEGSIATAMDVYASTLIINGYTSVGDGTNADINTATMLTAQNASHISVRGLHEVSLASPNSKIASVSLGSNVTGEYLSGKELLPIYYPKNGKFLYNGQTYTTGTPTGTSWVPSDIGKIVYESTPVQSGTTPNKYVVFGYQRMTAGAGNVLGTDWLPLRALTGN